LIDDENNPSNPTGKMGCFPAQGAQEQKKLRPKGQTQKQGISKGSLFLYLK